MRRDQKTGVLLVAVAGVLLTLEFAALGAIAPRVQSLMSGPPATAVLRAGATAARGVACQAWTALTLAGHPRCTTRAATRCTQS